MGRLKANSNATFIFGRKIVPVKQAASPALSVRTRADIYAHAIHSQEDEAIQKWEEYRERNRAPMPRTKKTI